MGEDDVTESLQSEERIEDRTSGRDTPCVPKEEQTVKEPERWPKPEREQREGETDTQVSRDFCIL